MSGINYVTGDATIVPPYSIIAHICNNRGGWGDGFSGALSKRWKEPERRYRQAYRNRWEISKLGGVQFVVITEEPVQIAVVNMIAQNGYSTPGRPAIDYDALQSCLADVWACAVKCPAYSVHMPRIGTGLAGGDWAVIEPMITRELCERGVGVTVYDLPK